VEDETDHLDPTSEINLETVKERAVKGVAVLTGRTFILNIIALIAQGVLWAYLSPEQFGVFWIVSAVVNFLTYFSDVGLAAALIQKKETPSESDLKTTFTVQQILVVTLLLVLYIITPILRNTHHLTESGITLLYALGISFLLSSLKSIPSVILERRLEFGKFVLPQVVETVVYNLAVVIFALKGFGISSFSYAVIIRGVVGLVTIYILQPWKPAFMISKKSLKDLLKFGVPYQINTLLAVVKDDGMTIILGSILGPSGLGILGTARKLAQYPLRFFMDNVTKVSFPAFSRMQHDKVELANSVTRSIFFISFLVFPSIIGLIILAPVLTQIIPKYSKWVPALVPLAIFSIDTIFAAVTTQLTNLFNAIGKIKITFKLMIMWSVLTVTLVPILTLKYSIIGASIGYALVGVSSIVAIIIAKRLVNFSLGESVVKPLMAAIFMGMILFLITKMIGQNQNYLTLVTEIVIGAIIYALTSLLIIGSRVIVDFKKGISALTNR